MERSRKNQFHFFSIAQSEFDSEKKKFQICIPSPQPYWFVSLRVKFDWTEQRRVKVNNQTLFFLSWFLVSRRPHGSAREIGIHITPLPSALQDSSEGFRLSFGLSSVRLNNGISTHYIQTQWALMWGNNISWKRVHSSPKLNLKRYIDFKKRLWHV